MKNLLLIFTFAFFCCSCQLKNNVSHKSNNEKIECLSGLMDGAWYEGGIDEPVTNIKSLKQDFIIRVDTNLKATNFISSEEEYFREEANTLDTAYYIYANDEWEKLNAKQKLAKVADQRRLSKRRADSVHTNNNSGKNLIRVINNTNDTVSVQMQDGSYICILQGKTKSGNWQPMQYWRFSSCGNSYYNKHFPPKTASSFITTLPNKGDYDTKLRFKLLGTNKFYYSNEFYGKINYCEFVEKGRNDFTIHETTRPHYKLDSLIDLSF